MDGCDIRDIEQMGRFIEDIRPTRILHLAAIARFSDADDDPIRAFETNVQGTENVLKVAEKYHIPTVFASTGSVYMPIKGKPPITEDFPVLGNSVYGCTKAMGDLMMQRAKVPTINLRYAHLYGPEKRMHGLIGGFLDRIKFGMEPVLFGGKQSNDFTYVDDVAEANVKALLAPADKWNQSYNIGTGEELTAEEAGHMICEATGWDGDIDVREKRGVDPDRRARRGARGGAAAGSGG